jgi:glutathione S-transferase
MKLYFAPGACSLSPHIVLEEAGIAAETEQVNNQEKKTKSGKDYWTINPKGQVPALQLDSGEMLTEGPVIVQYLADQKPASGLVPPAGTIDRYRVQEWLNFITSELHKSFGPIFRPTTPDAYKTISKENLGKRFEWLDKQLAGRQYLMGDKFTVADAYLFTGAALDEPYPDGPRQLAEPEGLRRSRCGAAESTGRDEGRGAGQLII